MTADKTDVFGKGGGRLWILRGFLLGGVSSMLIERVEQEQINKPLSSFLETRYDKVNA